MSERATAYGLVRKLRELEERELHVTPSPLGQNAFCMAGDVRGRMTIHASNSDPAWWGLAGNVLDRLDENRDLPWAAVFLDHVDHAGYVWSSSVLRSGIESNRWSVQMKSGRQFKFQAAKDLLGSYRFESLAELVGILRVVLDGAERAP